MGIYGRLWNEGKKFHTKFCSDWTSNKVYIWLLKQQQQCLLERKVSSKSMIWPTQVWTVTIQ